MISAFTVKLFKLVVPAPVNSIPTLFAGSESSAVFDSGATILSAPFARVRVPVFVTAIAALAVLILSTDIFPE